MRHIKQLSAIVAIALLILPLSARANPSKKKPLEKLEDDFSTAYALDLLPQLDRKRSNAAKFRVVIENTGVDTVLHPNWEYERKAFRSFGALGRWLKSRERQAGFPQRVTKPLISCRRGFCTYDFDGGIDHNHLYLQKISYGYRKGRPCIRKIYLLNG